MSFQQFGGPYMRADVGFELAMIDTTAGFTMMEGRAAPYNTWAIRPGYLEAFATGNWDKSIRESARRLSLLLWHDGEFWPIGVASEWRSRSDGLWGVWKLDKSNEARRAAQQARDGFMTGLSVGYQPYVSRWSESGEDEQAEVTLLADGSVRVDATGMRRCVRLESRLGETSLVPVPLFEDANVTEVREVQEPVFTAAAMPARTLTPELDKWRKIRDRIVQVP